MRSSLSTPNEIWQQQFSQRISHVLNQQFSQNATLYLGCSGGMDSMLLLHLFAQTVPERLHVISVDHQLQEKSANWSQFVAEQCQKYGVKCSIVPVNVDSGNLEAAARQARYMAFENFLEQDDVLILAHHSQDQAETVLLRLLQGTGVGGLSAMHVLENRLSQHHQHNYWLWRPLLAHSKQNIQDAVDQFGLDFVDDPMNHDAQFDRVWCRETAWPVLAQRFPKMQEAIGRCALLMQDADQILQEVLQQDLQACTDDTHTLNLNVLEKLSEPRQRQVLSTWMQGKNQYRPPLAMVNRLIQEVWQAKQDASSVLHYAGYYFTRFAHQLYRYSELEWQSFHSILPDQESPLLMSEKLVLSVGDFVISQAEIGLDESILGQPFKVFTRQGGEKIQLYGRDVHRPLKKIIQDSKIAPWYRHQIQILMYHNVILGVFTPKGFWLTQNPFCKQNGWVPKLQVK